MFTFTNCPLFIAKRRVSVTNGFVNSCAFVCLSPSKLSSDSSYKRRKPPHLAQYGSFLSNNWNTVIYYCVLKVKFKNKIYLFSLKCFWFFLFLIPYFYFFFLHHYQPSLLQIQFRVYPSIKCKGFSDCHFKFLGAYRTPI